MSRRSSHRESFVYNDLQENEILHFCTVDLEHRLKVGAQVHIYLLSFYLNMEPSGLFCSINSVIWLQKSLPMQGEYAYLIIKGDYNWIVSWLIYSRTYYQGPISLTDLRLSCYHFVLDLSPKTDLNLFMKSAPGILLSRENMLI